MAGRAMPKALSTILPTIIGTRPRAAPSFVSEPPGDGLKRHPEAMADTHRYVLNIASWLSKSLSGQTGNRLLNKTNSPHDREISWPCRG